MGESGDDDEETIKEAEELEKKNYGTEVHSLQEEGAVVWCGVVWCGVVWCGVVWCGVVWCGVVWCGVV